MTVEISFTRLAVSEILERATQQVVCLSDLGNLLRRIGKRKDGLQPNFHTFSRKTGEQFNMSEIWLFYMKGCLLSYRSHYRSDLWIFFSGVKWIFFVKLTDSPMKFSENRGGAGLVWLWIRPFISNVWDLNATLSGKLFSVFSSVSC